MTAAAPHAAVGGPPLGAVNWLPGRCAPFGRATHGCPRGRQLSCRDMTTGFSLYGWLLGLGRGVLRWLLGWWTVVFIGAQLAVLAFSPSSYGVQARGAVLRHIDAFFRSVQ